ncbi:response regulator [bacterium]|nr:response regulator [bacterium]
MQDISKPCVLVVDDTPENIDILAGVLRETYKVKVALHGEKALKIAQSSPPPDLILLDIMMPEIDGYEVCRRLKASEATRYIPVIFVTAKSEIEDETKGFACGAVDYITKPISPPIVLARVRTHLDLRKTQKELEIARDKAEDATRAKSDFLAKMSHEIRTPLNGLVANLEFLRLSEVDREQKECIDSAQFCADTLLGIIGDILDLSKIEAGKLELEMRPVCLQDVVRDVVTMMRHRAGEKALQLHTFLDPFLPSKVHSDSLRFRQVLINLIGNAVKFTEEGGIHVRLVRTKGEQGDPWIRGDVIDSGVGFKPEKAFKLFEAFSQEDSSTTRVYGGTGLGLTICKRIVEMMGGWIRCEGALGYGATFTFAFPVKIVEETKEKESAALQEYRIALFHDQTEEGSVLQHELESFGAEVTVLASHTDVFLHNQVDSVVVLSHSFRWDEWKHLAAPHAIPRLLVSHCQEPERTYHAIRSNFTMFFFDDYPREWLKAFLEQGLEEGAGEDAADELPRLIEQLKSHSDSKKVLIVDDFPMNRQVATKQMETFGFACELAENGKEALEKAKANEYSLILTDCSMPVMDGFAFTQAYREWESANNKHIPIIAMTANALKGDDEKCYAAGMDGYVSKPVTLDRLAEAIVNTMNLKMENLPTDTVSVSQTPTKDTAEASPVDLDYLAQILGEDDPNGLFEMLGYFLEEFEPLMESLGQVINEQDREQTRDVSHKAKGAAGNASAKRLSDLMKDIQLAALEAPWDGILNTWEDARLEYERVKQFIKKKG